jgi:hypothetical protein
MTVVAVPPNTAHFQLEMPAISSMATIAPKTLTQNPIIKLSKEL